MKDKIMDTQDKIMDTQDKTESNANRQHTEEWKENNSKMMIDWYANNDHPMLGKTHTDEAKAKIGAAAVGRQKTPEGLINIGKAHKMSIEKEKAIINAYNQGDTFKKITKELKVGNSGINRVLERNGIPKRTKNKNV